MNVNTLLPTQNTKRTVTLYDGTPQLPLSLARNTLCNADFTSFNTVMLAFASLYWGSTSTNFCPQSSNSATTWPNNVSNSYTSNCLSSSLFMPSSTSPPFSFILLFSLDTLRQSLVVHAIQPLVQLGTANLAPLKETIHLPPLGFTTYRHCNAPQKIILFFLFLAPSLGHLPKRQRKPRPSPNLILPLGSSAEFRHRNGLIWWHTQILVQLPRPLDSGLYPLLLAGLTLCSCPFPCHLTSGGFYSRVSHPPPTYIIPQTGTNCKTRMK